jgi:hypothetical protein
MAPISAYNTAELVQFFDTHVRRPWWRRGLEAIQAFEPSIQTGPIKVGIGKDFFLKLTEGSRVNFAAWHWMRPNQPVLGLDRFAGLQKDAGLDHMHQQILAKQLIARIQHTIQQHPPLQYWGESRIALLAFVATTHKPPPDELSRSEKALRFRNTDAYGLYGYDAGRARSNAETILGTAMESAAYAVADSLQESGNIKANLMIRTKDTFSDELGSPYAENSALANALWAGMSLERRLLIVAETMGANHRGFWVPLVQGEGGAWLPGGPEAWARRIGCAVYKDDLMPLSGFSEALQYRWKAYFAERFGERLFVSLPCLAPDVRGGSIVLGVLNVNVEAADVSGWRKAMHREWLELARKRAEPVVEIAFYAVRLMFMGVPNTPVLDTGSDTWNRLPVPTARRSLPQGDTEPEGDDE